MGYLEEKAAFGRFGHLVATPGDPKSGSFGALVPYGGAATFAASTRVRGTDDLPSATTAEGIPVVGAFDGCTVTDGTVLCYFDTQQAGS